MKLTDEQIDECYEVARGTFKRSQSQVRGQQIMPSDAFEWHFARAIEAAVLAQSEPVITDLSMMVRRLVVIARRHVPDDHTDLTRANDCLRWLQSKGLAGSPLRDDTAPVNTALLEALKEVKANAGDPEAVYRITKAAIAAAEKEIK